MKHKKIFIITAGGGHNTDKHYHDTIENRRSIDEFGKFLKPEEINALKILGHGRPFAVWGAITGPSNLRNWETMEDGDYVMVYRKGKIILSAEIALKTRNDGLAKYFWNIDSNGNTWELIYFLINDKPFNIEMPKLNKYFGFKSNYHPMGFMAINQVKTDKLLSVYGDLPSLLEKISNGEELEEIEFKKKKIINVAIDEQIEKSPTEHTEMQWRLIRLGNRSHYDVWVPIADQNREFNGETFKNYVIEQFQESIDVPTYIKNIDAVWKLGHSIKSAFEIEHSTSIYSGILRLSDLRTLTPNSTYPLFIIASRDKKFKVFDQLKRPTFANEYLSLDKVVKFLSYDSIRQLDEQTKNIQLGYNLDWLMKKAEVIS
ncbi:hypothetical protein ACFL0Y_03535 [Patescibacteria group bacterium]